MKNKTCKNCPTKFHFCGSCGVTSKWEEDYCSSKCWTESEERKGLFKAARTVVRGLSDLGKDALWHVLGIPDHGVGILEEVLDSTYTAPEPYDATFGDDRICVCGHTYARHFDPYECDAPVGCKYCPCERFVEKKPDPPPPEKKLLTRKLSE